MTLTMVRQIGADRLMFGSDRPGNVGAELAKVRSLGISEAHLAWVLPGEANKVFGLGLKLETSEK